MKLSGCSCDRVSVAMLCMSILREDLSGNGLIFSVAFYVSRFAEDVAPALPLARRSGVCLFRCSS